MSPTERLYWADAACTRFSATLLATATHDGRPAAVLDATCFYPTSGGQPHDTGLLGEVPVVDVVEEDDRIVHVLARPLDRPVGTRIDGEVDWERRLDHMQQHSGQHLLSAAFTELLGAATVSFHLGTEVCTIDLDREALTEADSARVEERANAVVLDGRPMLAREYDEDEALALPLRKAPVVHGRIRVVTVDGFDASACGGTHVSTTGQVGPIHIRRTERRHGGVRVEFLCGGRALRDYRARDALVQALAGALSVGVADLPAALTRLQEADRWRRNAAQRLAPGLPGARRAGRLRHARRGEYTHLPAGHHRLARRRRPEPPGSAGPLGRRRRGHGRAAARGLGPPRRQGRRSAAHGPGGWRRRRRAARGTG